MYLPSDFTANHCKCKSGGGFKWSDIAESKFYLQLKEQFFFFFSNELNDMAISFKLFKLAYRFIWSPDDGIVLKIREEKYTFS